jgi:hypothetical protein
MEAESDSWEEEPKKASPSPKKESRFQQFKTAFNAEKEAGKKIEIGIEFMRSSLSREEQPNLKDFWDIKHHCFPVFKKKIDPVKRNHLWTQYIELTEEARRIKEIRDEEAAFSVEQIEFAIEAIESDLSHFEEIVEPMSVVSVPKSVRSFIKDEKFYLRIQKELHFFKTVLSRLDSLRKEILQTEMRISHKNRILKRLALLSDQIYPKRKELIKKVGDRFTQDVEAYVSERFPREDIPKKSGRGPSNYVLREEIKAWQSFAKLLTLNSQVFTKTRKMFSSCWNLLKGKEKEEVERSKEEKENFDSILKRVEEYQDFVGSKKHYAKEEIVQRAEQILEEMKSLSLNRNQVRVLKDKIQTLRNDALEILSGKAKREAEERKKEIEKLKATLVSAIQKEKETTLPDLVQIEEKIKKGFASLELTLLDRHVFERNLSDLRSFILDKTDEQVSHLEELKNLLEDRYTLYEKVKEQVETYRKEMGGSRLDFEKAMVYRELYDGAKIHLDKEIEAIEELEERIAEL